MQSAVYQVEKEIIAQDEDEEMRENHAVSGGESGFLLREFESTEILSKGHKMTQQLCKRPFLLPSDA